jgi:heme-degrading monooxygenase HmoA
MWAQLIKARIRPGKEEEARNIVQEFESELGGATPPWQQITVCQNQRDPSEVYTLVVFESEEKARENERSPEQDRRYRRLTEVYEGQPEFVDMNVVFQRSG